MISVYDTDNGTRLETKLINISAGLSKNEIDIHKKDAHENRASDKKKVDNARS
jgi:hypothetical protein